MTEPRTVLIRTVDHGEITIPEPRYCTGHAWQPDPYLADITHNSVPVKASAVTGHHGELDLMVARISHAPYAVLQPEPHPVVSVAMDVHHDFAVEDVAQVARGLRLAARRLEALAVEALRLRGDRS
ncbi:hypothetical protein ABT186_05300 [Streptomyces sp. NPDC001634]|uniref:DUF6907 domain-containing protein n=1 Tax=Streptomyces sp. NPDC001634 TaxID=3154390 RepID=UPI00332A2DE4